ncbi:MAG TPA: aminotransferase class III-fold pyridoxal phosphate-dependent enzyme, partial [Candidatus Saccharimonadia bacterium]|nr:aminotransferase class III-fold pyridoxal phosphate-dependent enzyme [Candidatus Saccharimonadia bacterium]
YLPEYVKAIHPLVPDFVQLDYPTAQGDQAVDNQILERFRGQLDTALEKRDVAAIFIESGIITGWGGCRMAPAGFVETVRELTSKYGTLMVVDEVGTGFSRIGELFGINKYDAVADIATFAKGITNGAGGLGAVLSRAELVEKTIGGANYTSTFGWSPTACAAALETLKVHRRDKVWENSAAMGERMMQALRDKVSALGATVRGIGLEVCLDLTACSREPGALAAEIEAVCHKNGLHFIQDGDGTIQLMPACTISKTDLDAGVEILSEAVTTICRRS